MSKYPPRWRTYGAERKEWLDGIPSKENSMSKGTEISGEMQVGQAAREDTG